MRNRLRPDSNDPLYTEVEIIHDLACAPNCPMGITWGWYDDVVELLNDDYTVDEIIDIYTGQDAA
jgi:hypothetical protein